MCHNQLRNEHSLTVDLRSTIPENTAAATFPASSSTCRMIRRFQASLCDGDF